MRRLIADPYRMLIAIEYIGNNGPVKRSEFLSYISEFSEIKEISEKNSQTAAGNDVLFNLRELKLITGNDDAIILTSQTDKSQIKLYSGKDVYISYKHGDNSTAMKMLQTNVFFYSPEVRVVASYIYIKKGATRSETGLEFIKKEVYGHKFNPFTIDTTIAELERLGIVTKNREGIYEVTNLHDLIFAQLLVEEIMKKSPSEFLVSESYIKDLFDLKYCLNFSEFDHYLNRIRKISIPNLIIPGSYGKFSIDMNVAKEVKLV